MRHATLPRMPGPALRLRLRVRRGRARRRPVGRRRALGVVTSRTWVLCGGSEFVGAGAGELFEVGALAALFGEDGLDARAGLAGCEMVAVAVGELEAGVGVAGGVPVGFVHPAVGGVTA